MKKDEKIDEITITPELARIVAHICADGYLSTYKQRRSEKELREHPRKNHIRIKHAIRYVNTEPALVEEFTRDIKQEFNRKVVARRKNEYEVFAKWIYLIVVHLGAGKSHDWRIGDEILRSDENIKIEWLRAFFDDEAHVSIAQRRIVLNVVNLKGLQAIKTLLKELRISSTLCGPYYCRGYFSYHLCIYRNFLKEYSNKIGFHHEKKKRDLLKIINGDAAI